MKNEQDIELFYDKGKHKKPKGVHLIFSHAPPSKDCMFTFIHELNNK
jgi:hypothetical protein